MSLYSMLTLALQQLCLHNDSGSQDNSHQTINMYYHIDMRVNN